MATQKVPTLDGSGRVREKHLPAHLTTAAIAAKADTDDVTSLAENAVAGAVTADMATSFTGVAGWAYGNSWINSANYGAEQYPLRLPAKTGLAGMTELASSGFRMQDTAVHALGTEAPYTWPANRKGFALIGDLLNNLIEPDSTANRNTALESMRATVAVLSAASRIEQTDAIFTYSGTWSTLTATSVSGGTAKYVSHTVSDITEGVSYFDVAVPAGVNYICFVGTMAGSATNGATAIIREGGTELGRIATDDRSVATPYGIAAGTRAPVVFRIPGTTARTLRVTLTGTSGTAASHMLLIDCLITQSATPPLIVLVKPVQTLISTHDKPDLLTYLRTIPDTVKAEFGDHVLVVDPATNWDPATMLGADLLHPNELGQEHLANAVVAALKAEMLRRTRVTAFGALT